MIEKTGLEHSPKITQLAKPEKIVYSAKLVFKMVFHVTFVKILLECELGKFAALYQLR